MIQLSPVAPGAVSLAIASGAGSSKARADVYISTDTTVTFAPVLASVSANEIINLWAKIPNGATISELSYITVEAVD